MHTSEINCPPTFYLKYKFKILFSLYLHIHNKGVHLFQAKYVFRAWYMVGSMPNARQKQKTKTKTKQIPLKLTDTTRRQVIIQCGKHGKREMLTWPGESDKAPWS